MWIESEDSRLPKTASMADVSFRIECTDLPVDHTAKLAQSLCRQQPWLQNLPGTGLHPIHVAGSQNGWQRPDGSDQLLLLSKRTRLRIRIDADHAEQLIESLQGTTHLIDRHQLKILGGKITVLQPVATLFSRYTVYLPDRQTSASRQAPGQGKISGRGEEEYAHSEADEQSLMQQVIDSCNKLGYKPNKVLCGRSHTLTTPRGAVTVRSVLLADVPADYSLLLQEQGLGDLRLMGCGILIPHKDTAAVN